MDEVLVLWDVDHTLVDVDGLGREAYELAFLRRFGRPVAHRPPMAGRTDRAIAHDVLRLNGAPAGEEDLEALRVAAETAFEELAHLLPVRGRALPGALDALRTMAGVQSVLTGNLRRIAEVKLGPFGLIDHLDLDAGAYGWSHAVRANLVGIARSAARRRYERDFDGRRTVLVGDTPLDVEAALLTGAGVVAVATGRYGADELRAAGAHAVLHDLSDTAGVGAAIARARGRG
ncbi:haloacid dehalogenase-like hydrolase [Dactylosporangium aurantiacum]|uniref:Haloacid dehalogenase-like hydrolase n=1 Tax=Dactylosporangium aurantiacum TaxID=35754 RepID=A0A9Q9MDK2_9ACTN|nr:haloacid dehalogenase-like hydrolase [Dactylosporangium aurantiacum]MDG6108899.1 haloacid dehalogenase-like hydrolase [Dactylosporangium aurantiacum]UWZ52194.1 haloacid dehalogenase-like hydrolase [Dactylosporangium aurantiacum]